MRDQIFLFSFVMTSVAAMGCVEDAQVSAAEQALGSGGVPGAWCAPIPACDASPPRPASRVWWNHLGSAVVTGTGWPNHRGRDLLLNPGDPQWVVAKFSYGLFDKDLKDEKVAVYLLRDCGVTWEYLGTATTTQDDEHPTVEGVDDSGGRVYLEIPPDRALGPGRHRVHLVVLGDFTSTDVFIEVVPPGAPIVVSDVDGTLTTNETEEFTSLLTGRLPEANAGAAAALQKLATKGYHPMYLTARPEWLVQRTRDFLKRAGFPPGVVHTTLGLTGATGAPAADFKTGELEMLADKELVPAWAFGNTATDAEAYSDAGISPAAQRVMYRFSDTSFGSRRIERYGDLHSEIDALPSLCE